MTELRPLIVEDSTPDAELILTVLRSSGFAVDASVVDSRPALELALSSGAFDVILAESDLPALQGGEILSLARELAPDTPLVLVSSSIEEDAAASAMAAGARDSVGKDALHRLPLIVRRELNEVELRRRRWEAEAALRASEERFRRLTENADDIVYRSRVWPESRREYVSPALERVLGYTTEEYYETDDLIRRITIPEDRPVLDLWRERLCSGEGDLGPLRLRCRHRDGSLVWTEARSVAVTDETGRVVAVEGIVRDVTTAAIAQEELGQSERLFRGVFEGALDAMLISDDDGAFVDANAAACRLLEATRDELMRSSLTDFVPPAAAEAAVDAWRELRESGKQSGEIELLTMGGRLVSAEYAQRADVLPGRHLSVLRDVTPRREAERQRRSLLASVVNAQEEERKRIASDIHDDSVQALTALLLRLGMAKRATEEPATAEQMSDIEGAVQLSIARLRHLIFQLRPPALDQRGLAAALRLLLEQMRAEYGLEFDLVGELDPEPVPHVRAAAYRIAQEAILNVAKHSGAQHVAVTLANADESWLVVSIQDDGRGFDPACGMQPGHLGLTSMSERAEINGGRLRIDSSPGEGTLIELQLPGPLDETIQGGARATASRADR